MGRSYVYQCPNCKEAFIMDYCNGYFLLPAVDKEIKKQINSTNKEIMDFLQCFPEGRLDKERYTYICRECGYFNNEFDLSMYMPNTDSEELEECLIPLSESGYTLFLKNPHLCPKCGIEMDAMKNHDFDYDFRCTKCHSKLILTEAEVFRG